MALRRCTRPVDGTIPVQALLYSDEEILANQDSVGIYDGYVSTHFYYDVFNDGLLPSFPMTDKGCKRPPTTKPAPSLSRPTACFI